MKCGTVFSLKPAALGGSWTEKVIYNLTQSDGCTQLDAPVVIGSAGVLYCATETGGAPNNGRIFSLTPPAAPGGSWTETVLYDFTGPTDGVYPVGLTIDNSGVLYGATNRGGAFGYGTVFTLTPPVAPSSLWTEATLYAFMGSTDGGDPYTGVIIGSGGVLYGTTQYGAGIGYAGNGNIILVDTTYISGGSWTEVLYNFPVGTITGPPLSGSSPSRSRARQRRHGTLRHDL